MSELANSFLFVAARRRESPVRRRLLARSLAGEVGWHYAISRRIPTVTTFVATAGVLEVEKRRLDGGQDGQEFRSPRSGAAVWWRPAPRCRLTRGPLVRDRLLQDAYFERWRDFRAELLRFLGWAIDAFTVAGEPGRLSGASFDAIYTNAAVDAEGAYRLFDLEWELCSPLPVSWFVLRNVSPLAKDFDALGLRSGFGSLGEMYDGLCRDLGCPPALQDDVGREADVRSLILGSTDDEGYRQRLTHAFQRPFGPGFPRIADSDVIPRAVVREAFGPDHDVGVANGDAVLEWRPRRSAERRNAEAALESYRRRADEAARMLAAYQARDALITYRLAAQAHLIVRRLPWLRGVLKFAARSALRVRARLARVRQT